MKFSDFIGRVRKAFHAVGNGKSAVLEGDFEEGGGLPEKRPEWIEVKYHFFQVKEIKFIKKTRNEVCFYMANQLIARIEFEDEEKALKAYLRAKKVICGRRWGFVAS